MIDFNKKYVFILSRELLNIFKNIHYKELLDVIDMPLEYRIDEQNFSVEMMGKIYDKWELLFDYELVGYGMDDQEVVNDYGKKLYQLYDEMQYQAEHQK